MKITKQVVEMCKARFISLEDLAYLYQLLTDTDLGAQSDHARLRALGLLNNKGMLTQHALDMFEGMIEYSPNVEDSPEFKVFWASIPTTDAFLNYPATRSFRKNRAAAKAAFKKACEYLSAEEITRAMRNDVDSRKATSSKQNNLSFLKNPVRWLEDQEYLNTSEWKQEEEYGTKIE